MHNPSILNRPWVQNPDSDNFQAPGSAAQMMNLEKRIPGCFGLPPGNFRCNGHKPIQVQGIYGRYCRKNLRILSFIQIGFGQ